MVEDDSSSNNNQEMAGVGTQGCPVFQLASKGVSVVLPVQLVRNWEIRVKARGK